MRITDITVSRSAKYNLGGYESTDVFVSMKGQVEDDLDTIEDIDIAELRDRVREAMVDELSDVIKARGKKATREEIKARWGL